MKMWYGVDQVKNPTLVLRKAGYFPFRDPNTGKESFILKPTSGRYPRWHLYLKQEDGKLIFDLHLDQKKASYKGSRMHGGEYEGPHIRKELERIAGWVQAVNREIGSSS